MDKENQPQSWSSYHQKRAIKFLSIGFLFALGAYLSIDYAEMYPGDFLLKKSDLYFSIGTWRKICGWLLLLSVAFVHWGVFELIEQERALGAEKSSGYSPYALYYFAAISFGVCVYTYTRVFALVVLEF